MIILDSNVLSEPLKPTPDLAVVRWLDRQVPESLHLTTVSLAEVRYGVAAMPDGRKRTSVHMRLEDEIVPRFEGRVLDFDEPATIAFAQNQARLRREGRPIGSFDALIAAIATVHGYAVATRDREPFDAVGVRVIDPFTVEA